VGETDLYDRIGTTYRATRREEPRIAALVHAALGDARTVLNVGAGTGSYEPGDRDVLAVEPSAVMRAQRPPGSAPVIAAAAEALPFADGSFDATMAVLSDHHWTDRLQGLRELRRVARRRAVVFQWDPAAAWDFWLVREYLPAFARDLDPGSFTRVREALGATRVEPVPVPHDCADGFLMAYWRRPEAYLDPAVRANISVFALLDQAEVAAGLARLREDLASGDWHRRHADLLALDAADLGYTLLVAEKGASPA
jgi:SAM-dependent methyltransferase